MSANHTDCAYEHTKCERAAIGVQKALDGLYSILGTTKDTNELYETLAFTSEMLQLHAECLNKLKEKHNG